MFNCCALEFIIVGMETLNLSPSNFKNIAQIDRFGIPKIVFAHDNCVFTHLCCQARVDLQQVIFGLTLTQSELCIGGVENVVGIPLNARRTNLCRIYALMQGQANADNQARSDRKMGAAKSNVVSVCRFVMFCWDGDLVWVKRSHQGSESQG